MKCRQCGAEVPDTDRFCTECGNDLEKQRQEEQAEAEKTAAEANENAETVENDAASSSDDQDTVEAESQDTAETEKSEVESEDKDEAESAVEKADDKKDDGRHCPHCGAEIIPGDKFCTKCGQSIVGEPEEQKSAQAVPVPNAPDQQGAVPQGQQGAPYAQAPYQQPVQPYAQPPYQPGQPYPQQGQYPQQPMQNGYYGQPQYPPQQYAQQPQNNFYGQPYQGQAYQPQPNPQNQQPSQDPAQEKAKRGKTPFWVWIIIGVLAAAIIFCIVWFFVVPHTGTSNSANVAQSQTEQGEADGNRDEISRTYINGSSPNEKDAESALESDAISIIEGTSSNWRNPSLMSRVQTEHYKWVGNDLVMTLSVDINMNNSYYYISSINCSEYYTYVRFNNVYYENGSYHYESSSRPKGRLLNLYTDVTGDHHKVAGYSSEDDAFSAAGA